MRRLAEELGVDLATVAGTGPQGRITEQDVRGTTAAAPAAAGEGRREPIRGVKRQMFEHLTRAHREIPPVTWVEECDFTNVDLKRLLPLTLKAVAESLREFPELNARIEGTDLVYLDRYDLGIAVQTEQGLVVPVVRDCDSRSVDELDADVKRLAGAAQAGKLAPEELRGGTFTVTSAGRSAGLFTTPLVNHPQVAILGVYRIDERAVVRDGEIVVRRMGNVSVTFDHRVIDGKRAADFGLAVIERLQALGGLEVLADERLELRRGRAAVDPRDDPLAAHEGDRRHLRDAKALRDVGALVDVDLLHPEGRALLARDVREQALHAARRAGTPRREEDEQCACVP